jgi:hypothetical protein
MAENPTMPDDVRILSIILLAGFAEPVFSLVGTDLFSPPQGRRPGIISVTGTNARAQVGELGAVRSEVLQVLEHIRASTPEGLVRNAAIQHLFLLNTATTPQPPPRTEQSAKTAHPSSTRTVARRMAAIRPRLDIANRRSVRIGCGTR